MEMAHEGMIWSLAWHPLGHILCSGSNDHTRLDTHDRRKLQRWSGAPPVVRAEPQEPASSLTAG